MKPYWGSVLDSEEETRKLLMFREDIERRIGQLQSEIEDLRRAISEIDRRIVRQGFRQPVPTQAKLEPPMEAVTEEEDLSSVKSRDATILGTLRVDEAEIIFEPRGDLVFTTDIPPFQSFFIDRVLSNMRSTDEGRVAAGEIPLEEILSFDVQTDGNRILRVVVRNYGGERRLREIRSSLRWAFDKMYEKIE